MRKSVVAVGLCFTLLMIFGCKAYDYKDINTGLFANDQVAMVKAYDRIQPGVTTRADLEKLGFQLNAPNVDHVPGPAALRLMLGDNYFQAAFRQMEKIDSFLKDLNEYSMVVVPHKNLVEVSDYIYLSERNEKLTGSDANIYLVFKGDTLIYRARSYKEISEVGRNKAFLQGLFPWLKAVKTVKNVGQ